MTFKPGDKVTWGDDDRVYEVWSKHRKPGWLWLTCEGKAKPIEARAKNLIRVARGSRQSGAPSSDGKVTPLRAAAPKRAPKATEEDHARIEAAIRRDAREHQGVIDPNRVRAALSDTDGLTVPPRALSGRYSALAQLEHIESLGYIGTNDDVRSGNAGKPQRHWRWIGPSLEAAAS